MRPEDRESLLWALSEIADRTPRDDATSDDSIVPDSTLRAYREGRLSDDEARRVERRLVADPACRRRLEELAGAAPAAAPLDVRRRLLEDFGGGPRPRTRRSFFWRLGLAAAAMVALATGWLILRPRPAPLPAYEVQIAALTERRDVAGAGAGTVAEAYADSTVTIDATVVGRGIKDVEVGVYRTAGDRLERIAEDGLRRFEQIGAVRIEAPASTLVGETLGEHEVFVVIGWSGSLPETVTLRPGHDPAAALAAGGHQVHRLTLRLVAERSATPVTTSPGDRLAFALRVLPAEPRLRRAGRSDPLHHQTRRSHVFPTTRFPFFAAFAQSGAPHRTGIRILDSLPAVA